MNKFIVLWVYAILFFLISSMANAGQISSVFSESVFGVSWNDSIEIVQKKIPGGIINTDNAFLGKVKNYSIADGREVMQVKRRAKDKITYSFTDGRLRHIGIEFKSSPEIYGTLLSQLSTYFGAYETVPNTNYIVRWPVDNGIAVRLVYYQYGIIGSSIILQISDTREIPIDKKSMGF